MKHCIIVKFNSGAADKAALLEAVKALFAAGEGIEGVHGFRFYTNCVERSNRYDLAIVADMERGALDNWDASALHKSWKADFGKYVEAKAIFDFEDEPD